MLIRFVAPLAASIAVIGANAFALSPMAGAVAGSFSGVEPADVARVAAVYGLATAISALALAPLSDRFGHRRVLAAALIGLAAGLALGAAAPTFAWLCVGQAAAGLAAGSALPAIYALAARGAEPGRERETLGLVLTGWTVSLVVGVSLSATMAQYAHWRAVFAGLAVAGVTLAVCLPRASRPPLNRPFEDASVLQALRVGGVGPALFTASAYMAAFYGFYAFLGVHLTQVLGQSTAMAGLAPAAYGVGFGLAAAADRRLDRIGPQAAAPLTFAALVLAYILLAAAAAHGWLLILACLGLGLANHVGLNLIIVRLTALDPARRGAIMGLYSAATYLAGSAAALAYQPLFEHFGLMACAIVSALCILPVLAVSLAPALPGATLQPD